jgi:hypothetical protein
MTVLCHGERRLDDDALRDEGRAVARVGRRARLGLAGAVAEERVVPADAAGYGLRVGIEQDLGRIEAVPVGGRVGAVGAVAVEEPRARFGQIDMPDLVAALGDGDPPDLERGVRRVEEAELDRRRVLAEEREVDAGPVPGGAQRVGTPRARTEGRGGHRA